MVWKKMIVRTKKLWIPTLKVMTRRSCQEILSLLQSSCLQQPDLLHPWRWRGLWSLAVNNWESLCQLSCSSFKSFVWLFKYQCHCPAPRPSLNSSTRVTTRKLLVAYFQCEVLEKLLFCKLAKRTDNFQAPLYISWSDSTLELENS